MNPLIQLKTTPPLLIALTLLCCGLSPRAQAVVPAPDGGYPGQNTAEGQSALLHLAGGTYNTALGWASLGFNVGGNFNTAIGAGALLANIADYNTATGVGALLSNTGGTNNTATGFDALSSNTTGGDNTAIGQHALSSNTTGDGNIAIGTAALADFTHGIGNTAIGLNALSTITHGNHNTAVGDFAGGNVTGDNNIDIGEDVPGEEGESNTIRIGNTDITETFISGISGTTVSSGAAVFVTSSGKLGTITSSERFKKDMATMEKTSEAILSLRPVTFHYKSDTTDTPQFGLIAEEVAKVNPALVLSDKEGKPFTVRYDQVNAMLLNEFLKEHKTVQEQGAIIARQEKQIEALTAGLQKVSAQLEATKPAPYVVNNP